MHFKQSPINELGLIDLHALELVYCREIGEFGVIKAQISPGFSLGGVAIGTWSLRTDLRCGDGGGGRISDVLNEESSLSFYLDRMPDGVTLSQQHLLVRSDPDGICISISWETVNDVSSTGRILCVWTNQDRVLGKGPLILRGMNAQLLEDYMRKRNSSILPDVMEAATRIELPGVVPLPCDVEKKEEKHMMSYADEIRLVGLRGFSEAMSLSLAIPTGVEGSGLTTVVGANNAGKSTFWEGLEALARSQSSFGEVSFPERVRNSGSEQGVKVELLKENGESIILQSRSRDTSETSVVPEPTPGPPSENGPAFIAVPSRRQFKATFNRGVNSDPNWLNQENVYSRIAIRDQFTSRLFALHEDDSKKSEFNDLVSVVLGQKFDWAIDLDQAGMYFLKILEENGTCYSGEGLGDGVTSLLFIVCALYDSRPGTLVAIDEPELSLHPQLVKRLGAMLARFAKDRQIVVFTHSPLLVNWQLVANGARVARVFRRDGRSQIAQPGQDTLWALSKLHGTRNWRNPHSLGIEANEALFLEDGIIVVEGQEDAALLPRAYELLDLPLRGVIFGWGAGGEGNIEKVVQLLKELLFAKIAVLIDNDVPNTFDKLNLKYPDLHVAKIPAADIRTKPEVMKKRKEGVFDEKGKEIRSELKDEMRAVLKSVNDYLS